MKTICKDNYVGILRGSPKFILPKLPQCEEVSHGTFKLVFDELGPQAPLYFKIGMAMCNLWPSEKHSIIFNDALNSVSIDPDAKCMKAQASEEQGAYDILQMAKSTISRGWLAKMIFYIEREDNPLLTLYANPYDFSHQCIDLSANYFTERIMNFMVFLYSAYYHGQANDPEGISAAGLVNRIQQQCDSIFGVIGYEGYGITDVYGDDGTHEVNDDYINNELADPKAKYVVLRGMHGKLALDWIREKFPVTPHVKET